MCIAEFTNTETQMIAEVFYVSTHFRSDQDNRYKVILTDIESDNVAGVRYFPSLEAAEVFASECVFPSFGTIASPTFLPEIR